MITQWIKIPGVGHLPNGRPLMQFWSGYATDLERREHAEWQYLSRYAHLPLTGYFIPADPQARLWLISPQVLGE